MNVDMNILKGILQNRVFLSIIFLTLVLQIIIIVFGGNVFKVEPLGWDGWLISVLSGLFSLVFGALIRAFPIIPVPSYFTRDYDERINKAGHFEEELQLSAINRTEGNQNANTLSQQRWKHAIRMTALQNRTIKAFSLPDKVKLPTPRGSQVELDNAVVPVEPEIVKTTIWESLVHQVSRGRGQYDRSMVQMADPRKVDAALVAQAIKNRK